MSDHYDVMAKYKKGRAVEEQGGTIGGSTLLSLSLFIILLAFFIVLNSLSVFSLPKVDQTFTSLDDAFSTKFIETRFDRKTADERNQSGEGAGDSMEDMQGVLRSILPGIDVTLTQAPNDGAAMAVRMKKDRFDRLKAQLIPLFVRILQVKDGEGVYAISITSYVRDALDAEAELSYNVVQGYREELIKGGLASDRISLSLDLGNPSMMLFQFDKIDGRK